MKPEILKWVKLVTLKTVRDKRLPNSDIETLLSAGCLGYTQALKRFDPSRNVKFKTFAEYRIKGAVLDEVRKMIGDERCKNKRPTQVEDYDMGQIEEPSASIESIIDTEYFFKSLPLDSRGLEILKCRIDGMNLREIGKKMGFSESRASQLLAEIKTEIYPWFKEYLGSNFALVKHACPECGHSNEMLSVTTRFECEKCRAEMRIDNA